MFETWCLYNKREELNINVEFYNLKQRHKIIRAQQFFKGYKDRSKSPNG